MNEQANRQVRYLNQVVLEMNLAADAKFGDSASGGWCNFRGGVSGADSNGETMWINVSMFGKGVTSLAQYLTKGRRVVVAGRLTSESSEQYGVQIKVVANQVRFADRQNDGPGTARAPRPQAAQQSYNDEYDPFAEE